MAQVRNVSSDALDIPLFDLHVEAGETVDVTDDVAEALASNPNFKPVRPVSAKADKKAAVEEGSE